MRKSTQQGIPAWMKIRVRCTNHDGAEEGWQGREGIEEVEESVTIDMTRIWTVSEDAVQMGCLTA